MNNKICYWIVSIFDFRLIALALFMLVIATYPFGAFRIENETLKIVTPIVKQGDCVFVELGYDKLVDMPSIISAQIITDDYKIIALQMLSCNLEPGKHNIIIGFQLPRKINLPYKDDYIKAHMKITFRYEIFGFRNKDVTCKTDDFKIRE